MPNGVEKTAGRRGNRPGRASHAGDWEVGRLHRPKEAPSKGRPAKGLEGRAVRGRRPATGGGGEPGGLQLSGVHAYLLDDLEKRQVHGQAQNGWQADDGEAEEYSAELRRRRHDPIEQTGNWLKQVVRGYFHYHAVPGNQPRLYRFRRETARHFA